MGVVLPGWADEVLDLIGVSWPNVDEDDYREMATAMREFADDIDEGANEAHQAIQGLVGSAGGSLAVEALNAHWSKINGTHLKNLGECGRMAATALDGVAVLIEGAKIGALVQLGILAAEVIAAQAAAPFTLGLSEVGALAATQATRVIVKRLFKEVCQQVAEQVISIALTPVEEALGAMVGDLVVQLGANALGVQDGIDLGQTAKAGKDGFNLGVQDAKDSAKSAADNPMELLSAGGSRTGSGGAGGGAGAAGGFSFDPDEHDRVVTGLQSAGGTFRNKAGGKIGRARSHHGRTRGKDAIADAANAMLDKVIDGIADGVKKTAKHLDDNMTRGVKQMAKNHHDNDRALSDHFKGLGKDGKKDPKGPNGSSRSGGSGGGASANSNGRHSSRGDTSGAGGRGRKQVENPREAGRPQDSVCQGGEPVDMATGRMFIDQMDLSLPGSLPMLFRRSFESGYQAGRWMGPRWVCTFDERLEFDDEGVVFLSADRTAQAYPHPSPGEPVQASAGARLDLDVDDLTGHYTLTDVTTGLVREFTRQPDGVMALLTGVRDRAGHRVDFTYDAHGTPLEMTHSGGYRLLVTTDTGRITALHLAGASEDGQDVLLTRYCYSGGYLTEVYNSSGRPMLFANDAQGRILSWTDRNGTRYLYTYDEFDRVVEEGGADGSLRFHFEYGDPDPVTGIKVHSETNALGYTTRYQINEHAQVVAETDPLGNTTFFERDEFDFLLSQTDPLGRTTCFEYDDTGSLVAVTRPDGERSTAAYFGDSNLPTLITRPGGLTWRQTFDEAGRRSSLTDPAGTTTRYGYDESGHLASVTDALSNSTRVRCNPAGLPIEVTDRVGATSRYERDAFGRVTTIIDQLGGVTRLTWSTEGSLTSYTAPDGNVDTWTYDAEGNVLAHTDRQGGVTTFEYTPFETLAARTNPDGTRLTFTYDAHMQLVAVTNPLGQTWEYTYDAAGQLMSETDFNGRRVGYQLDAAGQLVSRTNPLGQQIQYRYDVLGQLVEKDADGAVTSYTYDLAGHLLQATSPDVAVLRTVDGVGNLITETVNGRTLTHTRDHLGRRIGRTTPGGHTSSWTYDQADRRTSLTTSAGRLDFAYDAAGHEVERTLGDRLALSSSWDSEHRLTGQILRSEHSVLQRRDYIYRADGILTGIEDQLNGPRAFDTDTAGRVTAVQAATWTERYAYDPAGNLTEADWPAAGAGKAAVGSRTYDGTQLITAGRIRYEYDAAGRTTVRQVTRLSKKPATWRYTWDSEDRLIHVTTPDGAHWRYIYDPFGRRISKERLGVDGSTAEEWTHFTWDGSKLAEQTTYAPSLPGPYSLSWEHRGLHPLAQTETITKKATADAPQDQIDRRFFAIVTDLVGTPTELVDTATDTIAWRTVPTLWGNTSWAADSATNTPLRFPGQYFDPETGLHYNLNRYYDPETARYVTPDPLGLSPTPNPDAYVHNPHTWCDPLGLMPKNQGNPLKKELMGLGKDRAQHVADGLGEDERPPGAYAVGKDRTTGKIYYGDSGPETGHEQAVIDAMPEESQRKETDNRPPGVCAEPRMFTNAIKDGAEPKNIDLVTVNPKGGKFKMCENCRTWVPGFGGEVLTG
ncbi:RHS repeat-associated core domain-containing protein [Streptomyces decoyicus]|uniref:RHS repeat-associated core domain-containing protein n=1 Tax=Streptomyces decoyicus TaxID=249567 RepID=UPI003630A812